MAGATLRAWRHEPPHVAPAIRTGDRPHSGHQRPHARMSPGLGIGVLVEVGLVVAVLAMAAHPPVPPPEAVTIAIVTSVPPLAAPAATAALTPPSPEAPLPPEAPPTPILFLPNPAAAREVLALPPDAGTDAPEAPHAEQVLGPGLPVVPAPPRPPTHLPPHPVGRVAEPTRRPPNPVARTAAVAIAPSPVTAAAPGATPAAALSATTPPSQAGFDSYEGRLKAAIQAALRYPPSAAMMGSDGRARVAFGIRDARPDAIRLVRSTGFPQLDLAALAAVRQAAYPSPPVGIAGREMAMLVWVEFHRADAEE